MRRVSRSDRLLLAIAYIGFISLGLPDTLLGVAWPSVRSAFDLHQSAIALIFVGAGCGYFLSSFFVGRLLDSMGVGMLLAASSALVALSAFGSAAAPLWLLFAASAPLHGLGSGAIDAGLNHYAAHHFSVRHMNWLHACWSLGATLGPLIMTGAIAWIAAWRAGYVAVGVILLFLSVLFAATRRQWDSPGETPGGDAQQPGDSATGMRETLRDPLVGLQVALFFVYAGVEATIGQWSFTLLTESRHVLAESAGMWVTIYWASIGVGRIFLGAVAERIGIDRLLRYSTLAAAAGTLLYAWNPAEAVTAASLSLIGLGLAPIYPSLMARTPQRLGTAMSAHAIGFQVGAATLGIAVLPSLAGVLAERLGLEAVATAAVAMALLVLALHEALLQPAPRTG
jgi:fucose permease